LRARGARPLSRSGGGLHVSADRVPPISQSVGSFSHYRLSDPDSFGKYSMLTVRTVYVGAHCIVVEDSTSSLMGTIDTAYAHIGTEFDNTVYPMLTQNFGNPLAMDQSTDQNGRIVMLFSPKVNTEYPGVLGFVDACDLFSEDVCPSSNQAEVFYAIAPTKLGQDYTKDELSWWRWQIRQVIAHETKHIVSNVERFSRATIDSHRFRSSSVRPATAPFSAM